MQEITTDSLKRRMDQGDDLNIIDVREPNEREEFNIGGKHIPLGRFRNDDIDELDELKDQEVIVYCRSGNRSGQAALILESKGFTNVNNLVGGMKKWQENFDK